ncbi:PadR family transcriptional regulator [Gimibacter soli]|uniref:PadR family transcriptional regulator n=1 Tax=Gimibacter soli TaxID=3024400 RepID=A0AAE9XT40_9PROT|nr:PadR family transcriptional regulator [Gimibacter soli]WCL52728.1 PadR family transcriptional regulator [Gimibacter soli]
MDIPTLCLGILSLGDATGYEIKKMVAEGSFSFFSEASFGSIYPALTRLTEEGLISCRAEAQSKRPDKKIYSLTPAGRAELEAALANSPGPDRNRSDFLAALLFAEAVAPHRIEDLIDERIAHHGEQIEALEVMLGAEEGAASRFVLEYGIVMQKAAHDFLVKKKKGLIAGMMAPAS